MKKFIDLLATNEYKIIDTTLEKYTYVPNYTGIEEVLGILIRVQYINEFDKIMNDTVDLSIENINILKACVQKNIEDSNKELDKLERNCITYQELIEEEK